MRIASGVGHNMTVSMRWTRSVLALMKIRMIDTMCLHLSRGQHQGLKPKQERGRVVQT